MPCFFVASEGVHLDYSYRIDKLHSREQTQINKGGKHDIKIDGKDCSHCGYLVM